MGFLGSDYPKLFFFFFSSIAMPSNFMFGILLRISSVPVCLFPILLCIQLGNFSFSSSVRNSVKFLSF